MVVSRLAPTPSGYLHLGNIYNFVLTWSFVRKRGGLLWLRIDDCDFGRVRDEYVEDIFETLNWLGISWDKGPKNFREYKESFSQITHQNRYWQEIERLPSFNCDCSRKMIKDRVGNLHYDGHCLMQNRSFVAERSVIRLADDTYPILWTKEDHPAYQLVSVVDDINMGVTHIIRGVDLEETSQQQKVLFKHLLGAVPEIIFHPLILSDDGSKLSKSNHDQSIKHLREEGFRPSDIYITLGQKINLNIKKLEDFLTL